MRTVGGVISPGVGPLGFRLLGNHAKTMLTEPYSVTDSRGELRRDTGGFLREIRRGTRDALREKSVDSHGRDDETIDAPESQSRPPECVEVTLFSLNTSLQPLGTQRPLCLRGPPQAGLTGWSPSTRGAQSLTSRTPYGSDTTCAHALDTENTKCGPPHYTRPAVS